jgi:ribonuclease HII
MPDFLVASDEVGLGSLAGPLFVCAVAVPFDWTGPPGLNDSKKLSSDQRSVVYQRLWQLPHAIRLVENTAIDEFGIASALRSAHIAALQFMREQYPDSEGIVDGTLHLGLPWARSVPKADSLYPAVMAASIIAKVNRDSLMRMYHKSFPGYSWDKNSGYGTQAHMEGLKKYGVTPLHRKSYAPIRKLIEENK